MDGKKMSSNLEEKALKTYGKWRPRLGRGAQWAGAAGLLSGVATRAAKNPSRVGKIVLPVTAAAGLAGVADKILEEKVEKSRKLKKLTGDAFEKKSSFDPNDRNTAWRDEETSGSVSDRPPWGTLTEGGEARNVESSEALIDKLFTNKARTAANAADQLKQLWPKSNPDGYSRSIGLPRGAGKHHAKVRKAFKE